MIPSKDVPFASPLISHHHLVGCPSNIRVLIIVELGQGFINFVLQMFGTAITDDVKHSLPDSHIFVRCHFKHSLPENIDILQDLARAQLLAGLKTNVIILRFSIL